MSSSTTMIAGSYLGAGKIEAIEKPIPEPGAQDVVVRVARAGICGTDMHTYTHGSPLAFEGMTIGHEFSGRVAAVGEKVADIPVGARVTVNPMINHLGLATDGAFAEYVTIPGAALNHNVFLLPDEVSDTQAALVEPLAVALRGVNRASLTPDSRVVIQGLGTIGLCALLVARHRGVRDIVAIDADGCRLQLAQELGARTLALGDERIDEQLLAIFGEAPGLIPSPNIDVVLDATGNEAALNSAISRLAPQGEVLILGTYTQPISVDMTMCVAKELSIITSLAYQDEFPEAITLVASGELALEKLVTHEFALADIDKAFVQQGIARDAIKVMINTES